MLQFAAVTVRRGGVLALQGVDLTLAAGELVGLVGHNGAGKSTLVAAAAGLVAPLAGTVRLCGADPTRARTTVRDNLGLAGQEIAIYPPLTVAQNLRIAGELRGMGAAAARRRADELLAPLVLEGLEGRRAGDLSGGQQRRLHAAIALVGRPRVLLLDEPTAGADATTRDALLATVRTVAAEGAAVLYITHHRDELAALTPRVVALRAGRVVSDGTLADADAAAAFVTPPSGAEKAA